MLGYFITFTAVGFILGVMSLDNEVTAFGIIVLIAILWGISYAPIWGLVSLGEMALGYMINQIINKGK